MKTVIFVLMFITGLLCFLFYLTGFISDFVDMIKTFKKNKGLPFKEKFKKWNTVTIYDRYYRDSVFSQLMLGFIVSLIWAFILFCMIMGRISGAL